jgi:hypothetical protein
MFDSALSRARLVLSGPGGSSNAGPGTAINPDGSINLTGDQRPDMADTGSVSPWQPAYVQPFQQQVGPLPNVGSDRALQFIPPLALFNDASQWVDRKYFVRPMPFMQAPGSGPVLTNQYFTPPPVNVQNLAAGQLNLQLQLGSVRIQAAELTARASQYYGG